jgi:serine/threonine-protein kinase HipA
MNKKPERRLEISLGETLVGHVVENPNDRNFFEFEQNYVEDQSRPTLSLCFQKKSGQLDTQIKQFAVKLHPFFSNLLPEGHLREYLASKIGIKKEREFLLLAELGNDLPGAVHARYHTRESLNHSSDDLDDAKENEAENILKFSLAGVQMKFSAVLEASGGLTIPAVGANGDHIVKLPSSKYDLVPESEFASLKLAKLIGIDVAEAELFPTENIANLPKDLLVRNNSSLIVKRFDRQISGKRIHIEDFAQVFGLFPDDKYDKASYRDIADVLWQTSGEEAIREFIRRLVFTIAIGNSDMHLKNWSLLYPDGVNPILSPAYDFVPTIGFMEDENLALSLGGEKQISKVNDDNFLKMAAKANIPSKLVLNTVHETVERFAATWNEYSEGLPFPPSIRRAINQNLAKSELFKVRPSLKGSALSREHTLHYFSLAGYAGLAGQASGKSSGTDFYNQAFAARHQGDFKSAIRFMSANISQAPTAQSYYNRGLFKADLNDFDEAIADLTTSLLMQETSQTAYNIALLKWNKRKIADKEDIALKEGEAEQFFEKAIQINPRFSEAHYNLGVLLLSYAPKKAIECFDKAISINEFFVEALFNKGVAQFITADFAGASHQFHRAAALDSNLEMYKSDFKISKFDTIRLLPLRGIIGPVGPHGPAESMSGQQTRNTYLKQQEFEASDLYKSFGMTLSFAEDKIRLYENKSRTIKFGLIVTPNEEIILLRVVAVQPLATLPDAVRAGIFMFLFEVIYGPDSYHDNDRFRSFHDAIFDKVEAGQTQNDFLFEDFNFSFLGDETGHVIGVEAKSESLM